MNKVDEFEVFIKKNFLPFWGNFLDFEIQRSLKCIHFIGSPNAYIIMQIIAWNQHLSIISQSKYMEREDVSRKYFENSSR